MNKSIKMEEFDPKKKEQPQQTQPEPAKEAPKKESPPVDDGMYVTITDLPTKGNFYPEGTKIQARSLKVMEVKHLSQLTAENANDVINDVLRKTIRGIEVDELFTADKMYLVFWLRANTYKDSGYQVNFNCMKCNKPSTFNFELDSLKIQDYEVERYGKFTSEVRLPSGHTLTFKLLRVKDEDLNERFLKQNENSMMDFDKEIVSLCRMIETVDGKEPGMIEKYSFVTNSLEPADFAYIQSFVEDCGIGVEPTIDVKCNKCGGSTETVLPFRPDFFLPKVQT